MMVACLVTGTVVWIAMRSQLIALLSVEKTVYPIDGFESLLGSKFTLVNLSLARKYLVHLCIFSLGTGPIGTAMAGSFLGSKEGSLLRKLLDNHMTNHDESFIPIGKGIETTSTRSDYAFSAPYNLITALKDYACKVRTYTIYWLDFRQLNNWVSGCKCVCKSIPI